MVNDILTRNILLDNMACAIPVDITPSNRIFGCNSPLNFRGLLTHFGITGPAESSIRSHVWHHFRFDDFDLQLYTVYAYYYIIPKLLAFIWLHSSL